MKRSVLVLLTLFAAATAQAGVEARFAAAFASPGSSIHYVYRLRLVSGELAPGATVSQHVTLYDIPSLVTASISGPPGWIISVQPRGFDPNDIPLSLKQDSTSLLNITWRWNGTATVTAPAELGTVTFDVDTGGGGVISGSRYFAGQSSTFIGPRGLIGRINGPAGVTP